MMATMALCFLGGTVLLSFAANELQNRGTVEWRRDLAMSAWIAAGLLLTVPLLLMLIAGLCVPFGVR